MRRPGGVGGEEGLRFQVRVRSTAKARGPVVVVVVAANARKCMARMYIKKEVLAIHQYKTECYCMQP